MKKDVKSGKGSGVCVRARTYTITQSKNVVDLVIKCMPFCTLTGIVFIVTMFTVRICIFSSHPSEVNIKNCTVSYDIVRSVSYTHLDVYKRQCTPYEIITTVTPYNSYFVWVIIKMFNLTIRL